MVAKPGGTVWARRGDDRGAAVRGQPDQQASGHPARPVDENRLPGTNLQRVTDRLVGGQGGNRQRRGDIEWHAGRYGGDVPGGGDELLSPGPLLAQRQRVRGNPVAGPGPVHLVSHGDDDPGRLDAEGHRQAHPEVPASCPGNLVPVAHPARVHVNQDLIRPQRARSWQFEKLDLSADPAHSRGSHESHPSRHYAQPARMAA
jgi:hypothetical protein